MAIFLSGKPSKQVVTTFFLSFYEYRFLLETQGWDFTKNWGEIKTKLKPFEAEKFWENLKKYEAEILEN